MLYENAISGYETFISLSGFPSQLSFKGRHRFIMPLYGGHAWEPGAQFSDPMQNFHRYRKTGLNIDDEEGLFHDVIIHMTRIRCNAGTHPVFGGGWRRYLRDSPGDDDLIQNDLGGLGIYETATFS